MFCSNCGTKLNDDVKFCFNCGTQVSGGILRETVNIKVSQYNQDSPYVEYLFNTLISNYTKGIVVEQNDFYTKAGLYGLSIEDVNVIYNDALSKIEKLKQYIFELIKESEKIELECQQVDELILYGKSYKLTEDNTRAFLRYIIESEHVAKKRSIMVRLLNWYSKNGETNVRLSEGVDENAGETYGIDYPQILELYRKEIEKFSDVIATVYPSNQLNIDEQAYVKLEKEIKHTLFFKRDIEKLVQGYERKVGIYEKKRDKWKISVKKQLESRLTKRIAIFDKECVFTAKYFLLEEALRLSYSLLYDYEENTSEKMLTADKGMKVIETNVNQYFIDLKKSSDKLEMYLQCEIYDADYISAKIDEIIDEYENTEQFIENLLGNKQEAKERRQKRKENRGRWEGGGFGLGGALKGAATAGALNVTSGFLHSSFNFVENMITSVVIEEKIIKRIKTLNFAVTKILESVSDYIYGNFEKLLERDFKELVFYPYTCDTEDDKFLREQLWNAETPTTDMVIELMLSSPYNPRNLACVCTKFQALSKNSDFSVIEFAMQIEELFGTDDNGHDVLGEMYESIREIRDNRKEDVTDEDIALEQDIKEMLKYFQHWPGAFDPAEPEAQDKIEDYFKEAYSFLKCRRILNECLEETNITNYQKVIEALHIFYENNAYDIAEDVVKIAVRDNVKVEKIVREFYSNQYNHEIVNSVIHYVIEEHTKKDFVHMFSILAKLQREQGETLLLYAAQCKHKALMDELIKYGADTSVLSNQMMSSFENQNYNNATGGTKCLHCGKTIKEDAKFCNFCGARL